MIPAGPENTTARNRCRPAIGSRKENRCAGAGLLASAALDKQAGEVILKVVNSAAEPRIATIRLDGLSQAAASGTAVVLAGHTLADENSLGGTDRSCPRDGRIAERR